MQSRSGWGSAGLLKPGTHNYVSAISWRLLPPRLSCSASARGWAMHGTRRRWGHRLACLPACPALQGEGTQIEAARVFPADDGTGAAPAYQSYGAVPGRDEWRYMNMTAEFVLRWRAQEHQAWQDGSDDPHSEL